MQEPSITDGKAEPVYLFPHHMWTLEARWDVLSRAGGSTDKLW